MATTAAPSKPTPSTTSTGSRLLDLPGELRNRIYEYALCEDKPIQITKESWKQPNFLRVCRQIKFEASSIYYLDNEFDHHAPNFDLAIPIAFYQHAGPLYNDPKATTAIEDLDTIMICSWNNLLRGLRAFFDGRLPLFLDSGNDEWGIEFSVAGYAFDIVRDLRDAGNKWETIEKVLKSFKSATQEVVGWEDDK